MLRKHIFGGQATAPTPRTGEIDVAATATVFVTSEAADHPIDNVFDDRSGPGGSRWVAGEPGQQELTLAFDAPQTIRQLTLEVEEREVHRQQELWISVSADGGQTWRELLRQEFVFSPPDTTFEREDWSLSGEAVTHVRLVIKPDKGGKPCRATLTSLALL